MRIAAPLMLTTRFATLPTLTAVLSFVALGMTHSATAQSAAPAAAPAEARWFKGNLHTHSLWSDGDDYPEMIADWYKRQGYHFLGISDHNVLQVGDRWLELKAPVSIGGNVNRARPSRLEKYLRVRTRWWNSANRGNARAPQAARRSHALVHETGNSMIPSRQSREWKR